MSPLVDQGRTQRWRRTVRGRRADEDPFAALRTGADYRSEPTTSIPGLGDSGWATTPAPPATPGPPARRGSRSGARRAAGILKLGVAILIVGALVAPLLAVVGSGHSSGGGPSVLQQAVPLVVPHAVQHVGGAQGATPRRPGPTVSFLRPAALRFGLARIARLVPGAGLTAFTVTRTSLIAIAIRRGTWAQTVYLGPAGAAVDVGAAIGERPIPIAAIHPGVVGALIAELNRRFEVGPREIARLVISSPPGRPAEWLISTTGARGQRFDAALDGRGLRAMPIRG
jgi:hypothetical protein